MPKNKKAGSISLSCYEITTKQMMLGKEGEPLTMIPSVLKYMRLFETYEYRDNPARGSKTHYIDSRELTEWNKKIQKSFGRK